MFDGENCVRCGERFKFEELTYGASGWGVCADCKSKINPDSEPFRLCPHDEQKMNKEVVNEQVLIDRCPSCGGVWLDGHEIEIIKRIVAQEGRTDLTPILLLTIIG